MFLVVKVLGANMLLLGARDEALILSTSLQVCGTKRPQRRLSIELNASSDIFSYKLVTLRQASILF